MSTILDGQVVDRSCPSGVTDLAVNGGTVVQNTFERQVLERFECRRLNVLFVLNRWMSLHFNMCAEGRMRVE
jgi:hypothetical protein